MRLAFELVTSAATSTGGSLTVKRGPWLSFAQGVHAALGVHSMCSWRWGCPNVALRLKIHNTDSRETQCVNRTVVTNMNTVYMLHGPAEAGIDVWRGRARSTKGQLQTNGDAWMHR